MLTIAKAITESALDLLFPKLCLGCNLEGDYLCVECRRALKRCEFQICPKCGSKSPFGVTHAECVDPFGLDGLISAVPYKEPLGRKIVESCKYKFMADMAPIMASLIAEEIANLELQRFLSEFVLVPLPLHKSRKKWRGFNQSELIANELSRHLSIPVRADLLQRKIKTTPQAELDDDKRKTNVSGAFETISDVTGIKIAIIDDVSTTRSTLTEACKALKNSGATGVWGIAFAQG